LLNSKTKEMKTKSEIVDNWLVRYTGLELKSFGEYILLTNFDKYVKIFAENSGCEINGEIKI
jgi:AMP nucleosidase